MRTVPAFLFALAALMAAWLSMPASAQTYALCPSATPVADWLPYAPADAEPTLTPAPTRWTHPVVITGTALALTERAEFHATYSAWWRSTPAAPWPFGQATITATATVTFTPGVTTTATVTATATVATPAVATPTIAPTEEPTPPPPSVTPTTSLTATATTTPTVFFTVTPTPTDAAIANATATGNAIATMIADFRATVAARQTTNALTPPAPTATMTPTLDAPGTVTAIVATLTAAHWTSTPTTTPTVPATATPTATRTPVVFPCRLETTRCGHRLFVPFNGKGRRR